MLKIGVFGAGHLGKIHLQQWSQIDGVVIAGFCEPNDAQAQKVQEQYGIPRFHDTDELIRAVDAIDIVSTTTTHYDLAKRSILAGKHVFIEKPLANTIEEAAELVELAKEANVKCQVGHVERYNPAFLALSNISLSPLFIEAHRLAEPHSRGADVSVILDLMIHDIDIVLHLVKSPVRRIAASGVSVLNETADIANARIEFDNGCVANLTSSRISLKKMRKMRLFQRDAYIGIDFLDKKTEIIRLKSYDPASSGSILGITDIPLELENGVKKIISIDLPDITPSNAIKMELSDFASSIIHDRTTKVTIYDGYLAMDIAHQILKKMSVHQDQHNVY